MPIFGSKQSDTREPPATHDRQQLKAKSQRVTNGVKGREQLPTINQLVKKGRKPIAKKEKAPALRFTYNALKGRTTRRREGNPQKRGRVHHRSHHDAQEAEFGSAQDRSRAVGKRNRGNRLYPRRGAWLAGALCRPGAWWACEGSSWRALSYRPRHLGPGGVENRKRGRSKYGAKAPKAKAAAAAKAK